MAEGVPGRPNCRQARRSCRSEWKPASAAACVTLLPERRAASATAALVQASRDQGPDLVLDLAEERAPQGFAAAGGRDAVLPFPELEAVSIGYKRKAGFDPTVLNGRDSLSARIGGPA